MIIFCPRQSKLDCVTKTPDAAMTLKTHYNDTKIEVGMTFKMKDGTVSFVVALEYKGSAKVVVYHIMYTYVCV